MTFSSCDDGDELDTNQYVKGIALNAFGPSPVARGGELRFIGSNLNQVTAVSIPGCADITDITVVSTEEIRVTVPQTAEPGLVTLRTPSGDITTISRLTYTEPVGFDADPFSPSTIKPGSVLTISGEYLNLVTGVEFADGVSVAELVHLFARHVSATTSETSTAEKKSKDSDAGIAVCILILQEWLTETPETVSLKDSDSVLCTNLYISLQTMTESLAA